MPKSALLQLLEGHSLPKRNRKYQARSQEQLLKKIWASEHGYSDLTHKGDEAGWCCIGKFLFTYAILSDLHSFYYEDRWCYDSYEKAKAALEAWDGTGEPTGWHRHPATGRRVDENGNTYVNK